MKASKEGVNVNIMGKEFLVACPDEERESLIAAAGYLDRRMREIHNSGKVLGAERTAIMAALNIANELLQMQRGAALSGAAGEQLRRLQRKIDTALES